MPSREQTERLIARLNARGRKAIGNAESGGLIDGLPVEIVSDDEAEKAAFVVCVFAGQESEGFKASNVSANCADCGSPIVHRPHAPKAPPKICVRCAFKRTALSNPST
jgi:hypothetical protein